MKIAIIGPRSPLAQVFLELLDSYDQDQSLDISFFHKSDLSPLIEFGEREIAVVKFDIEKLRDFNPKLIIFFPQEDYKEEILLAEQINSKIIDATGAFINDPTIPLIMPTINHELLTKHQLVSLPSYESAIFIPILHAIDRRFVIRRASIICHDLEPTEELFLDNNYTSQEINSINEISKILDNDTLRLTVSHREKYREDRLNYFVNVSMAKPFSTEELLLQLRDAASVFSNKDSGSIDLDRDLILRGYRRDLSLDSGICLWLSTRDPYRPLTRGIIEILDFLKAD